MKKYIWDTGGEARHTECLDLRARMFGYTHWHDLCGSIHPQLQSAPDAQLSPEDLLVRVRQYLNVLVASGFTRDQAWDLIDDVQVRGWFGTGRFMKQPA